MHPRAIAIGITISQTVPGNESAHDDDGPIPILFGHMLLCSSATGGRSSRRGQDLPTITQYNNAAVTGSKSAMVPVFLGTRARVVSFVQQGGVAARTILRTRASVVLFCPRVLSQPPQIHSRSDAPGCDTDWNRPFTTDPENRREPPIYIISNQFTGALARNARALTRRSARGDNIRFRACHQGFLHSRHRFRWIGSLRCNGQVKTSGVRPETWEVADARVVRTC